MKRVSDVTQKETWSTREGSKDFEKNEGNVGGHRREDLGGFGRSWLEERVRTFPSSFARHRHRPAAPA